MRKFGGMGLAWFVATVVAVTIATAAVNSARSEVTGVPTAFGISASGINAPTSNELPSSADGDSGIEQTTRSTLTPPDTTRATGPAVDATTTTEQTTTTAQTTTTVQAVSRRAQESSDEPARSSGQDGSASSAAPTPAAKPSAVSPTTTQPTAAPSTTTTTQPVPSTTTTTQPVPSTTTTTTAPAPKGYTRVIETDGGSISVLVEGDDVTFARAYAKDGWQFVLLNSGPPVVDARFMSIDSQYPTIIVFAKIVSGTLTIAYGPS